MYSVCQFSASHSIFHVTGQVTSLQRDFVRLSSRDVICCHVTHPPAS